MSHFSGLVVLTVNLIVKQNIACPPVRLFVTVCTDTGQARFHDVSGMLVIHLSSVCNNCMNKN